MKKGIVLSTMFLMVAGCGSAKVDVNSNGKAGGNKNTLGRIDDNSRCEAGKMRESLVDLNQDEVPDVRKVYAPDGEGGERLFCREADLNFDGTKDIFVFFDDTGLPKRDEVDLDYDGTIDIVSTYVEGKLSRQELDTNSDHLIDRVRYLADGVPVRLEGDTDGDGRIDYWEYYEGGRLIRVGVDNDGDGQADNWNRDEVEEEEEEEPADEGDEGEEEGGESDGEEAE